MKLLKTKFYLPAFVILLMGVMFLFRADYIQAATGVVSFPQDTNVTFSVGEFVIVAGSNADEVTTTGTNITITISPDQTFTFKSTARKGLDTSGIFTSKTCLPSESTVVITPPAGDSQRVVIITPVSTNCVDTSAPGGSGTTVVSTPTPTPSTSVTPTPTVTVTPTPTSTPSFVGLMTPASRGFVSLAILSLKEGDVISSPGSSDPDVYIPNVWGYKRLFLNPAIFNFYGHLGGFRNVKNVVFTTRDKMVTSGLFRNCETNDKKVYGVETTGEDTGKLHWVNTTGERAVADDPDFFKKVFCINTKEFNWYPKGADYTSVNQIPDYTRKK